jgi:hypothetical protein
VRGDARISKWVERRVRVGWFRRWDVMAVSWPVLGTACQGRGRISGALVGATGDDVKRRRADRLGAARRSENPLRGLGIEISPAFNRMKLA